MMRYVRLTIAAALVAPALVAAPAPVQGQGIGVDELQKMEVPTRWRIERGKRIYENQCAGCHGDDGTGLESYPDAKFDNDIPDLTDQEYRYGGSTLEVYEYITEGPSDAYHPTFSKSLRYQERWAVTHFVRAWGLLGEKPTEKNSAEAAQAATGGMKAPPAVRRKAKTVAEKGRCAPDVMKNVQETIGSQLEPKGDDQIQKGKKLYKENGCATCHGEEGKVTDAMEGQEIAPRNFRTADEEWYNGANPLAIFNTLTNGARGQMRGYKNQIEPDGRWAIAHFLLEEWVPKEAQSEVGDEQLKGLCRQRSASEPPDPMWTWETFDNKREAVDYAMQRLAENQPEERTIRLRRYGPVKLAADANKARGEELYRQNCRECHGAAGQGQSLGPFGVERVTRADEPLPRLRLQVRKLQPAHAGGTFRNFAQRSTSGVHATLPNSSGTSTLKARDWKDLHAYVASLDAGAGAGTIDPEIVEVSDSESGPDAGTDAGTEPDTNPGAAGAPSRESAPDAGSGSTGPQSPSTTNADAE